MSEQRPEASQPAPSGLASAAIWATLASATGVIVMVARSKVSALILGPDGVGAAAQIYQVTTLAMTPVLSLFLGAALTNAVARAKRDDDAREIPIAWTLSLIAIALLCSAVFAATPWLVPERIADRSLVSAALLGSAAAVIIQFPIQIANARLRARRGSLATAATTALIAIGVVAGTLWNGLTGHFIGFAVGSAVAIPVSWWLAGVRLQPVRRRIGKEERTYALEAIRLGAAALAGGVLLQLALVGIRSRTAQVAGDHDVGQFQAAWSISQSYFMIVVSALFSYMYPRFAKAEPGEQLRAEVDMASRFVLRQALPVILMAIAIRQPLLTAVYSDRFAQASELLGIQLVGDSAKALALVLYGCVVFKGTAKRVLVVDVIGYGALLLGFLLLQPHFGLLAAGYAYVASCVLHLVANAVAYWSITRDAPPLKWIAIAIAFVFVGLGANELTHRVPWSAFVLFAVGFVGALFSPMAIRIFEMVKPRSARQVL